MISLADKSRSDILFELSKLYPPPTEAENVTIFTNKAIANSTVRDNPQICTVSIQMQLVVGTWSETHEMYHGQAPAGSRIFNPGFPGRDFAESRDPGIFRDGISLKYYPGILPKKYRISQDFLLINLVNFIHFRGLICL